MTMIRCLWLDPVLEFEGDMRMAEYMLEHLFNGQYTATVCTCRNTFESSYMWIFSCVNARACGEYMLRHFLDADYVALCI